MMAVVINEADARSIALPVRLVAREFVRDMLASRTRSAGFVPVGIATAAVATSAAAAATVSTTIAAAVRHGVKLRECVADQDRRQRKDHGGERNVIVLRCENTIEKK